MQVGKTGVVGKQGTRVGKLPLRTDCGESCANRRPLLVLHAFRFIGLSFLVLVERMSALPPKADIAEHDWHVRFVPKADMAPLIRSRRWLAQVATVARLCPVPWLF